MSKTPKEIVAELDQYIIGQNKAKNIKCHFRTTY